MTEREKMLAGDDYNPRDPELIKLYWQASEVVHRFNQAAPSRDRMEILREFIPDIAVDAWIEPNFSCEYGKHFSIGARTYLNVNCFLQDCGRIDIGSDVLIGPGVQFCTASHPLDPDVRVRPVIGPDQAPYVTRAAPIEISDRCWLGAAVTVIGGVSIGAGSVIGAGSIVTRDIPPGVVARGVPARVTGPAAESGR